jgi:hypothetical protein
MHSASKGDPFLAFPDFYEIRFPLIYTNPFLITFDESNNLNKTVMKLEAIILDFGIKNLGQGARMSKRERFVVSIITTRAFSKMTLQDKLLSLGKLIAIFNSDNGYTPRLLEQKLEALNSELNHHTIKTWEELYSRRNFEPVKITK